MNNNILILGSTGNLGDKLFKYCIQNKIFNLSTPSYIDEIIRNVNKLRNIH